MRGALEPLPRRPCIAGTVFPVNPSALRIVRCAPAHEVYAAVLHALVLEHQLPASAGARTECRTAWRASPWSESYGASRPAAEPSPPSTRRPREPLVLRALGMLARAVQYLRACTASTSTQPPRLLLLERITDDRRPRPRPAPEAPARLHQPRVFRRASRRRHLLLSAEVPRPALERRGAAVARRSLRRARPLTPRGQPRRGRPRSARGGQAPGGPERPPLQARERERSRARHLRAAVAVRVAGVERFVEELEPDERDALGAALGPIVERLGR